MLVVFCSAVRRDGGLSMSLVCEEILRRVDSRSSDIYESKDVQKAKQVSVTTTVQPRIYALHMQQKRVIYRSFVFVYQNKTKNTHQNIEMIITSKSHIPWTLHACLMKTSSKTTCMCVSFRTAYA